MIVFIFFIVDTFIDPFNIRLLCVLYLYVQGQECLIQLVYTHHLILEIDRYIGLPIFFPIFKHFTIIGYRFWKKKYRFWIFFFFLHT